MFDRIVRYSVVKNHNCQMNWSDYQKHVIHTKYQMIKDTQRLVIEKISIFIANACSTHDMLSFKSKAMLLVKT